MLLADEQSITITETHLSDGNQPDIETNSIQIEESIITTTLPPEESIYISTMPLPEEQSVIITESPLPLDVLETFEVSVTEIQLEEFPIDQEIEIISTPLPVEKHSKCTQTEENISDSQTECLDDDELLKSQVESLKSEIAVVKQQKNNISEMYSAAVTKYEINSTNTIQEYEVKLAEMRIKNEKSEHRWYQLNQELENFSRKQVSSENTDERSLKQLRVDMEKQFADEKDKMESRFLSEKRLLIEEKEKLCRLKTENKELMTTYTSTVAEYDIELKNQKQDFERKLQALKVKNKKLEQTLDDVQDENREIKISLTDAKINVDSELSKLKTEMQAKFKKEKEKMEKEFDEEKAKIIEKNRINNAYYEETIVKQEEMWMKKIAQFTSERNKLQEECASHIQELAVLKNKVFSLEKHYEMSIKGLKVEMEETHENSEDRMQMHFQRERMNLIEKYRQTVRKNEINITTLQHEYETKITQLKLEKERNNQKLSDEVKDWESKLYKSKIENENRNKEYEIKIEHLESKIKATKSNYEKQVTECRMLESSMTELKARMKELEQKDKDNKEQISSFEERMADDNERYKILIDQLNIQKQNETEMRSMLNNEKRNTEFARKDIISGYETKLASKQMELNKEVKKHQQEVDKIQNELSDAENEIKRLEKRITEIEEYYKTLIQQSKEKLTTAFENKDAKLEEIYKIHDMHHRDEIKEKQILVKHFEATLRQMKEEWEEKYLTIETEKKDLERIADVMTVNFQKEIQMIEETHKNQVQELEQKLKEADEQVKIIEQNFVKDKDQLNQAYGKVVSEYELKIKDISNKCQNQLKELELEQERNDESNRKKLNIIRQELSATEETYEAEIRRVKNESKERIYEKENMKNDFSMEIQRINEAHEGEVKKYDRMCKQLKDESEKEMTRLHEESKNLKKRIKELELEIFEKSEATKLKTRDKTNRVLDLEMENSKLLGEINLLYAQEQLLITRLGKYEQSIIDQGQSNTNAEENNFELKMVEKTTHESQCRYKMEFDVLTKRIEDQRKDLEIIRNENRNLQKEVNKLRNDNCQDLEDEVHSLKIELTEIRNEHKNCSKLKDEIIQKDSELRKMNGGEKFENESVKFEQEYRRCEVNRNSLVKRLEPLFTTKRENGSNEFNEKIKQLELHIITLTKENTDYERKITDIRRHYEHQCDLEMSKIMKDEIQKLGRHYENEKREIERLYMEEKKNINLEWVRKYEEDKTNWNSQLKKIQNRIEILLKEKSEAEKKRKELEDKLKIEEEKFNHKLEEMKLILKGEFEMRMEALRKGKDADCQFFLNEQKKQIENQITVYKAEIEKHRDSKSVNKHLRAITLKETNLKDQIYKLQADSCIKQRRIMELERQLRTERDDFERKLEHLNEDHKRDYEEMRKKLEHEKAMVVISRDALHRELNKIKIEPDSPFEIRNDEKFERGIDKFEYQKRLEDNTRSDVKYTEQLFSEKQEYESRLSSYRSDISKSTQSKIKLEEECRDKKITSEMLQEKIKKLEYDLSQIQRSRSNQPSDSCRCAQYVYPTRDKQENVKQYAEDSLPQQNMTTQNKISDGKLQVQTFNVYFSEKDGAKSNNTSINSGARQQSLTHYARGERTPDAVKYGDSNNISGSYHFANAYVAGNSVLSRGHCVQYPTDRSEGVKEDIPHDDKDDTSSIKYIHREDPCTARIGNRKGSAANYVTRDQLYKYDEYHDQRRLISGNKHHHRDKERETALLTARSQENITTSAMIDDNNNLCSPLLARQSAKVNNIEEQLKEMNKQLNSLDDKARHLVQLDVQVNNQGSFASVRKVLRTSHQYSSRYKTSSNM